MHMMHNFLCNDDIVYCSFDWYKIALEGSHILSSKGMILFAFGNNLQENIAKTNGFEFFQRQEIVIFKDGKN